MIYRTIMGREWAIDTANRAWLIRTWDKRGHASLEKVWIQFGAIKAFFPEITLREQDDEETEGEDLHSKRLTLRWLGLTIGIHLGFWKGARDDNDSRAPNPTRQWGWYRIDNETWFWAGTRYWVWRWPILSLQHHDTWLLDSETQAPVEPNPTQERAIELGQTERHKFSYRLASGEVQETEGVVLRGADAVEAHLDPVPDQQDMGPDLGPG